MYVPRAAQIQRDMTQTDVVVIGGGANGTGLARDLAKRGLQVTLFEKGDIGRGATGASSGMIHGGPRYLLNDVDTTKHSCEDSGYIQQIASHIIFRIPYLLPVPTLNPYGKASLLLHDVYFDVYDRYAILKNGIPHARLTISEMLSVEPGIRGDFMGAVTLDEWGIDAVRLCLLNLLDAERHGAVAHTYTEVVGFVRNDAGALCGVRVRETGQSQVREVYAKAIVNCGGPWAEQLAGLGGAQAKLRPGKGVHLIYEKRLSNFAVIMPAVDGRAIFAMPYQNETWVGTTDDDYYGDLDDLWATQDEIGYLREAVVRVLPDMAGLRLIGTRVGVRNTIHGWGKLEDELSRGYKILEHQSLAQTGTGFYSVVGGKLASYRVQAQDAADKVCEDLGRRVRCETHLHQLSGADRAPTDIELAHIYGISPLAARRILSRHGSQSTDVLDVGRETHTGFSCVCPCEPTLECEVRYCIRREHVVRLGDLMTRCRIGVGACQGTRCAVRAAQIFAQERCLAPTDEREALMEFLARRWRTARPIMTDQQLAQAELLMTNYTGLWQVPSPVPLS
ncbi:MAG: glycerol-3-phosphate dehydrogenase/oxidase [Myxococcota bacterium]